MVNVFLAFLMSGHRASLNNSTARACDGFIAEGRDVDFWIAMGFDEFLNVVENHIRVLWMDDGPSFRSGFEECTVVAKTKMWVRHICVIERNEAGGVAKEKLMIRGEDGVDVDGRVVHLEGETIHLVVGLDVFK